MNVGLRNKVRFKKAKVLDNYLEMPKSTTIFDLSEDDLRVILSKMQPENSKKIAELGIHQLRSRITEWLLKNDFSTMHSFLKDSEGQWKLPERIDCDTCGRYKIGNWKEVVTILKQPLSSNMILDPEKLQQSVELVEIPLTQLVILH
uniref:SAM domain-containing protein n=1 Tax=Syphacia muris TaxID=451379 RepID=A0A0N5AY80_9BILA